MGFIDILNVSILKYNYYTIMENSDSLWRPLKKGKAVSRRRINYTIV